MNKSNQGVSIHTGFPNPATDGRLQPLSLDKLLIWHSASTFMMNIDSNDWQSEGIFSGDIAIIDRALGPRHIDLVIWLKESEFMVSRFYKMPRQATVWGVVTSIVHRYRKLS